MAIYLGPDKVSPMFVKTIEKTVTINNGTTTTTYNTDTNFVLEDPDNLASDLPVVTEWTRPSGWPDLDALPELTEGVYCTFDNTSTVDCKWAAFRCWTNTGQWRVSLGHVENNTWVEDSYWNLNSNTTKEIDYSSSNYDYVVFRIIPASTNHITLFYFSLIAAATLGTYGARAYLDWHCIERVGKLPYVTSLSGSGETYRYSTIWMERDNVEFGNALTSLSAAWYRARRLLKVEFGNWTGENCNITSLSSVFEQCLMIEELDLSQWNTTNWHVTTLNNAFFCCYRLKKLKIPWNTSAWGAVSGRTITMSSTFSGCFSLEELDLSTWNVSEWNCTTLYGCWSSCLRLKKLNVSNWNTTNWHTTSLYLTFYNCRQLVEIDLSNWNTTNWAITSLYYTWYYNIQRRNFNDIKNWVTTNWNVTTMLSTFEWCCRVLEIDLSNWNVSNWACTSLYGCWSNCQAMRSLKVGTWDMTKTDKWKVTNIAYLFNECNNLEDTTFFNWNPKNWAIVRMGYAFSACYKLKEIDLTNWNNATWTLSDGTSHFNYICRYCRGVKKIDISVVNPANITLANYGSNATDYTNFYECRNLVSLKLPSNYAGHLNFRYNYLMPRTEIVRIFNALPTALSGAKIIITELRYKLTNDDIAIATNKGYTVS